MLSFRTFCPRDYVQRERSWPPRPPDRYPLWRFAARVSGLAFGLALAVRPAGSAEVSGVNGAPQARPRGAGRGAPLRLEGPTRTMRGVPPRRCDIFPAIGVLARR